MWQTGPQPPTLAPKPSQWKPCQQPQRLAKENPGCTLVKIFFFVICWPLLPNTYAHIPQQNAANANCDVTPPSWCNLINRIDSIKVKSRLLSLRRDAMRYISIDLETGIKECSQQRSNVLEEQNHFEDEKGMNVGVITKKERRCWSEIDKGWK